MLDRAQFYALKKLDPETDEFMPLVEGSRREGYWTAKT